LEIGAVETVFSGFKANFFLERNFIMEKVFLETYESLSKFLAGPKTHFPPAPNTFFLFFGKIMQKLKKVKIY